MRFLADMGVSLRVVEWLRGQGHDVVHLREQGLQRLPNGEIFRKAVAEDRMILTFDLDFGEIAALEAGQTVGVLLFRLHNTRAAHVTERLDAGLRHAAADLKRGSIVVVEESQIRIRELPIQR